MPILIAVAAVGGVLLIGIVVVVGVGIFSAVGAARNAALEVKAKHEQRLAEEARQQQEFQEARKRAEQAAAKGSRSNDSHKEPTRRGSPRPKDPPKHPRPRASGPTRPTTPAESLTALKSGDERQRQWAYEYLEKAPVKPEIQPKIAAILEQDLAHPERCKRVVKVMAVWATPENVPALIRYLEQESLAPWDRRPAMDALARLKDPRGAAILAKLIENFHVRREAQTVLTEFGPAASKEVLQSFNHPDRGVAEVARELTRGYGTPAGEVMRQCATDLGSTEANRKRAAAAYLAEAQVIEKFRSPIAQALEPLLDDPDRGVWGDGFKAMRQWASTDNVPKLIETLQSEDGGKRKESLDILVALKDPRAIPPIAGGLTHLFTRKMAVDALIAFGPQAETALHPYLLHNDRGARKGACEVLQQIGTRQSIRPLQVVANGPDRSIAQAAQAALTAINQRH